MARSGASSGAFPAKVSRRLREQTRPRSGFQSEAAGPGAARGDKKKHRFPGVTTDNLDPRETFLFHGKSDSSGGVSSGAATARNLREFRGGKREWKNYEEQEEEVV